MLKQRLHIDTSVFGGYYDEEFAEFTIPLFERLNSGEFGLLFQRSHKMNLKMHHEEYRIW